MSSWTVQETSEGVQFKIKVLPRASKNEIGPTHGDALKVRLTAPPVDGAANEACLHFLAQWLGVSPKAVTIVTGQSSRHKLIRVDGLKKEDVTQRLK